MQLTTSLESHCSTPLPKKDGILEKIFFAGYFFNSEHTILEIGMSYSTISFINNKTDDILIYTSIIQLSLTLSI